MIHGASTQTRHSHGLKVPGVPDEPLVHIPLRPSDAERSIRNIVQWNSYLPTDCVRRMVSMGWDYTT